MLSYEKIRKEYATLNLKRVTSFTRKFMNSGFLTFALFEKNVLALIFFKIFNF